MTTLGVISDTHGLLRPEAIAALQGVDLIVHAGDIGSLKVIQHLASIAPVTAIRGNIDRENWAQQFAPTATLEINGRRCLVLHNLKELNCDPAAEGYHLVISGHSHKPTITEKDGVLYLNPGSAGPRRFKLPITLARVNVTAQGIHAEIENLLDEPPV